MAKIEYITQSYGKLTLTDGNTSADCNGNYINVHIVDFEPNSVGVTLNSQESVGTNGGVVYGARINPRAIELTVAAICIDKADVERSRKLVLSAFPLAEEGILFYTNSTGRYRINCFLNEYPGIETKVGNLWMTTFYLTAYSPHWIKDNGIITLSCTAGEEPSYDFESQAEIATPAYVKITCTEDIPQKDEMSIYDPYATITLQGGQCGFRWNDSIRLLPSTDSSQKQMYIKKPMSAGDNLYVDWGLNNALRAFSDVEGIDVAALNYVDLLSSSALVIRPGHNTLYAYIGGSRGAMTVELYRYEYVKAV